MFSPDQYQLLDFGEGRKLERFGPYILDRPSPAAERFTRRRAGIWSQAHGVYERTSGDRGRWTSAVDLPATWSVRHGQLEFELKRTEFGHLGVFPEQAENWDWLARELAESQAPVKVLNLFAYTGGSTLAAAAAGAQVVHVDSAANTVAWARRNAALSGLTQSPIRWITEDAPTFVERELRRGNTYNAVILDPPSYGHGPKGEPWKLEEHLGGLLQSCGKLIAAEPKFVLLTSHSPGLQPADLASSVSAVMGEVRGDVSAEALAPRSEAGHALPSGIVVRWRANSEP